MSMIEGSPEFDAAAADMHDARIQNPALPGRPPVAPPRAMTPAETAIFEDVKRRTADLERELMRLPEIPHRARAIDHLEQVHQWAEKALRV